MSETIVRTHDLCVDFRIKSRAFGKPDILSAVRNASLEIRRGETFGLVGESGCGKSTLAGSLVHFVPLTGGTIEMNGVTLDKNSGKSDWKSARKGVQMIFQDPFGSLNPRFQVWQLISEPMLLAGEDDDKLMRERASELLEQVGLSSKDAERNIFESALGESGVHNLRRADLGARCLGAFADLQPASRSSAEVFADLSFHNPQSRARETPHRPDGGHVHGTDC